MVVKTPDLCQLHAQHHLTSFCEECEEFVCIQCKIKNHTSHTVLAISEKRKKLEKSLKSFKRETSTKSISGRVKVLEEGRKIVENSAEDVKEKISAQHDSVKQWLSEIYDQQISTINKVLNDERNRFKAEINKLKNLIVTRNNIKKLLSHTHPGSFDDLMCAHKNVSNKMDTIWRKPTYVGPVKEYFAPTKEIFAFLKIHILGYCVFQSVKNTEFGEPARSTPDEIKWEKKNLVYFSTVPVTDGIPETGQGPTKSIPDVAEEEEKVTDGIPETGQGPTKLILDVAEEEEKVTDGIPETGQGPTKSIPDVAEEEEKVTDGIPETDQGPKKSILDVAEVEEKVTDGIPETGQGPKKSIPDVAEEEEEKIIDGIPTGQGPTKSILDVAEEEKVTDGIPETGQGPTKSIPDVAEEEEKVTDGIPEAGQGPTKLILDVAEKEKKVTDGIPETGQGPTKSIPDVAEEEEEKVIDGIPESGQGPTKSILDVAEEEEKKDEDKGFYNVKKANVKTDFVVVLCPNDKDTDLSPTGITQIDSKSPSVMNTRPVIETKPPSLLDQTIDYLRRKVRIVELMNGKSCRIQAAKSEVILHVPEGVHGALLANIHTNAARFIHHIPENDCLVAPICEYHLEPYLEEELSVGKRKKKPTRKPYANVEPSPQKQKYKIKIPHIVRDVERVRRHLKVRHGNLHSGVLVLDNDCTNEQAGEVQYSIDDKYVTILTSHFCYYIITAEGINCCGKTAHLLFFGSLRYRSDTHPPAMATVKVFISNKIEDFQNDLEKKERMCKNPSFLLERHDIDLPAEEYDTSKSKVELSLKPTDTKTWEAMSDMPTIYDEPVDILTGGPSGHICKLIPKELVVFYLGSSRESAKHFRAQFKIQMKIKKKGSWFKWPSVLGGNTTDITEVTRRYILDVDDDNVPKQDLPTDSSAYFGKSNTVSNGPLTDCMLLNLSEALRKDDLRSLAIHGLGMEANVVANALANHPDDINSAADQVFKKWLNSQENESIAHTNLYQALIKADMPLYAKHLSPKQT